MATRIITAPITLKVGDRYIAAGDQVELDEVDAQSILDRFGGSKVEIEDHPLRFLSPDADSARIADRLSVESLNTFRAIE